MADKKKPMRDDEGGKFDPARAGRVKDIRDRLSADDDHGPIPLDGGKFYEENRKLSPDEVNRSWANEAKYPSPSAIGDVGRQGRPGAPVIPAGENVNEQHPPESGGLIEAILHGLGLRKGRR